MEHSEGGPRATLVYDTHCASCSRFARVVRSLDRGRRITFASLADEATQRRLRPQLGAAYDLSFHLVLDEGARVVSGEYALEDLARLLPWVRPLGAAVFSLPLARRVPAALYRSFSAGRQCALPVVPA